MNLVSKDGRDLIKVQERDRLCEYESQDWYIIALIHWGPSQHTVFSYYKDSNRANKELVPISIDVVTVFDTKRDKRSKSITDDSNHAFSIKLEEYKHQQSIHSSAHFKGHTSTSGSGGLKDRMALQPWQHR